MAKKADRTTTEQLTPADAVSNASGEVQSLAEEMGSWRDNMSGTSLENTSKFEEVSECADALEAIDIDSIEIPDEDGLMAETFTWTAKRYESRATRLGKAIAYLEMARDALQNRAGELEDEIQDLQETLDEDDEDIEELDAETKDGEKLTPKPAETDEKKSKEDLADEIAEKESAKDSLESAATELDSVISDLEGIDFPGMY